MQRDPITKEELTGKFKEVQDEQDAILFGDYRAVLRSKGIMVNSISDFVAPPDELAKAKASQESAGQESVDHRNRREREFIQQYMGKDLALEAAARENGRLVEVDEEAEDYELTPKELNARRLVERNRHREMCKTRCEHGEYDYEKFKARQVPINPAKMKERKYLTRVVHESGPDDDVCPDEPENNIIAFSPKYENSLSDFRISAIGFREKYLADDKKKRNGIPIRKMTEAQKGVALDYDTLMARHGGRPDVIMNPAGTVFVGGFVFDRKPTCQDNMQTVYVLRNGYVSLKSLSNVDFVPRFFETKFDCHEGQAEKYNREVKKSGILSLDIRQSLLTTWCQTAPLRFDLQKMRERFAQKM